ncbi:hypothetical protein POPTR_001G414677v4 [Populus trichocarpa]|uniref:Uncharacterized protein n=1 Tax=Populus trichocarpa TaxID=3694 RepID=A0ACC0TP78_POPTR|nr:hypothetical protein POPTR_001G414677v4 [Populus trichocarpa]
MFGYAKCERKLTLDWQRGEGFLKLGRTKLPDLIEFRLVESVNFNECETECFKNCSCAAYTHSNTSGAGNGCIMWFGDLIDIREQSRTLMGQDIFMRVPTSELVGESQKEEVDVPLFELATIANATNYFSQANVLGEGGFGHVYKGQLLSGQEIAVKKVSKNSKQGAEEFRSEVVLIAKLQHRNLEGLLGICIQVEERMLIYEYMANKSLDYFIFVSYRGGNDVQIILEAHYWAWKERFNVVLGIARGVLYLHQDSKLHIVRRDLKPSNILLDTKLNAKISDFGLARISGDDQEGKTKRVVGAYGYTSR